MFLNKKHIVVGLENFCIELPLEEFFESQAHIHMLHVHVTS